MRTGDSQPYLLGVYTVYRARTQICCTPSSSPSKYKFNARNLNVEQVMYPVVEYCCIIKCDIDALEQIIMDLLSISFQLLLLPLQVFGSCHQLLSPSVATKSHVPVLFYLITQFALISPPHSQHQTNQSTITFSKFLNYSLLTPTHEILTTFSQCVPS